MHNSKKDVTEIEHGGSTPPVELEKHQSRDGVLLDVGAAHIGSTGQLRLAKDGHVSKA